MIDFILWYITLSLLGLITFPLTYHLFPKFADRGYTFARVAGLLIWSYAFWLLSSLGITSNNISGILLGLAVLAGLSLWSLNIEGRMGDILNWFKAHISLLLIVESLFLITFAALALFRAANPEALGTEKPMELAFINAILRSPTFPPRDPWLSGYAISYYHFGYIMTAMLAKITTTAGSVAFNLMIALIFALSAVGSYGILHNLLALRSKAKDLRPETSDLSEETANFSALSFHPITALLAPLFLLLISNFEALLEVIHQKGILWTAQVPNFWTWLDIRELRDNPAEIAPIPDRFWWWWRASRVIQEYDLMGNHREIIDEFPAFSFVLGDLHPHVLALPFVLLSIAIALYIYLGGWSGKTKIFTYTFTVTPLSIFIVSLTLGGIAFLNTWDILSSAALIASAYALKRAREKGWSWQRLEDFLYFGIFTGVSALLLYTPFYLGFASQAGGILPNLINPTRGAHLWVMFGTLLFPIFSWMIYLAFPRAKGIFPYSRRKRAKSLSIDWTRGFGLVLGLLIALWLFSWLIAWLASVINSSLAFSLIQSQGLTKFNELFSAANARRLAFSFSLLTLLGVAGGAVSLLIFRKKSIEVDQTKIHARTDQSFILLIIILGALLVIAPEFFYLRDQFMTRMNTIFKFYYQAWILWSLAGAYAIAILIKNKRGYIIFALVLTSLLYPFYGVIAKARSENLTLDSAAHLRADEAAAIEWLQRAPDGVLLEAVGGSYTGYARISTNSGLPTVLGWPGHEVQWRGGYEEMGSRQDDIETIYISNDWAKTKILLEVYEVRYVIVGALERGTYPVNFQKLERYLEPVFVEGELIIYLVP